MKNLTNRLGRKIFVFFSASTLLAVVATHLPAGFKHTTGYYEVVVDGQNFGVINDSKIQKQLVTSLTHGDSTLGLERAFITDPSLYEWAKSSVHNKIAAKTLELKHFSDSKKLLSTYTLTNAKPVSWNISKDEEKLTGYRESIEVSFASISVE
jgi:hypothetical protein